MWRVELRTCFAVLLLGFGHGVVKGATVHVDVANCPGPGDGSVGNPFCSIQAGIDAASSSVDEVAVEPGTYDEIIDFSGKAITVRSSGGAGLTTIDATFVSNPGDGRPVVRCDSGEGRETVLDGFTLTGGTGDTSLNGPSDPAGGGMFNSFSDPTVVNCVFVANFATFGGGMENNLSDPLVMHCSFIGNGASSGGGMDNFFFSSPIVVNCVFAGNTSPTDGAGMNNSDSSPSVVNCVFSGNMAGDDAGAIKNTSSHPTLTNCTVSWNTAVDDGGGMYLFSSNPTLTNCIFWGNSDSGGMNASSQIFTSSGTPTVNFTNLQGGWTGSGGNNLNTDPLFVDADGADDTVGTDDDDVRLMAVSLSVDAGDNEVVTEATDLDGVARVRHCVVDMGAYESTPTVTTVIGDTDCDLDVDGVDFSRFALCFNKAGNPPRTLGCQMWMGIQLDDDDDGDVDGVDFATFALCFNKAGNPPRTVGCPEN